MNPRDEDEVWRDIVENYGEAPSVEEAPPVVDHGPRSDVGGGGRGPRPRPAGRRRNVSCLPRLLPSRSPSRRACWPGSGSSGPNDPALALVIGWQLPGWMSTLLIGAFIGGFGYLVATMNREPRDPWDNGARI